MSQLLYACHIHFTYVTITFTQSRCHTSFMHDVTYFTHDVTLYAWCHTYITHDVTLLVTSHLCLPLTHQQQQFNNFHDFPQRALPLLCTFSFWNALHSSQQPRSDNDQTIVIVTWSTLMTASWCSQAGEWVAPGGPVQRLGHWGCYCQLQVWETRCMQNTESAKTPWLPYANFPTQGKSCSVMSQLHNW